MKVLIFKHHANDPLSFFIAALTRGQYVHAAMLEDEKTNTIIEAFWPHVRRRVLGNDELSGIDVFSIKDITPAQEQETLDYARQCLLGGESYSVVNLFRFLPMARAVLGEGQAETQSDPTFCSQFVFKSVLHGGGITLLRAHSEDVDPEHLSWSPLLVPEAPLKPA